jgi:hypothetical protein
MGLLESFYLDGFMNSEALFVGKSFKKGDIPHYLSSVSPHKTSTINFYKYAGFVQSL